MPTAQILRDPDGQTLRLPKDFQFAEDEVLISKIGDIVLMCPRSRGWEAMARSVDLFSDDYMESRDQPGAPDTRPTI